MREISPLSLVNSKTLVFLLGCQRSGTTWLTSIFDASPDVLTFVEPFAPAYGIVPDFPGVFDSFDANDPSWEHWMEGEFRERLWRRKYLLLSRSMRSPFWFKVELDFARLLPAQAPGQIRQRIRQFELLNLNRLRDDSPIYPKEDKPSHWIVKELRLAGKIPMITSAFPDSYLITIMRHPCASVNSILNWFDRGRLVELQSDMGNFVDQLESQEIGTQYSKQIARCRTGTLAHTLALYWRVSYETIWRRTVGNERAHWIIYEDLASSPLSRTQEVSRFLNLPFSNNMLDYVKYSSTTQSGTSKIDPLDTIRDSRKYYLAWIDDISDETQAAVFEICGESFLLPHFDSYYPHNVLEATE